MSISCRQCPKTWPRDPVLEVECPVCGARPGEKCKARRPSGHNHTGGFAGLPPWGHDERDLAAALAGAYGGCPEGRCGLEVGAREVGVDLETMVAMKKREIAGGGSAEPDPVNQTELAI